VSVENLYAVIMAGGSGTRLWPRSRGRRPKQFLDLLGPETMLQTSWRRLRPLLPAERILVATGEAFLDEVRAQLPELAPANLLGEPHGRDTAAAIGLAATHLHHRAPAAKMAVVTADHLIAKEDVFRALLAHAAAVADDGWLVTLGIQPTFPSTGLGYVERGERLPTAGAGEAYRVARFVEKPDQARAEQFLAAGTYSWNSGMFVWRVERIREELQRHMPALFAGLAEIEAALGTPDAEATFQRVWPTLPRRSIDFGVMEHADRVAVLPADIGWNDVGSWPAVYEVSSADEQGNVVLGRHLGIDTTGSLIYSPDRLIATVGLADLIVVDAGDALLICPRSRAQEVKQLVAMLQERGWSDVL
jgi:mannose-1-phosphate guanylyltransferase